MRRLSNFIETVLIALAIAALAPASNAQDWEADEKAPGLPRWQYVTDLLLPKDAAAGTKFGVVELPGPVLGKAKLDLDDLRLTDATGTRLPFARRVMRDSFTQLAVRIERRFDAGPTVKDRAFEESFELDAVPLAGHNDIEIQTPGADFRRIVQIYGANSADFANAQSLLPAKTSLVHFTVEGRLVEVNRFRYAAKTYRYLKVRVDADPYRADDAPTITSIIVRQTEKTVGKYLTYPVRMGAIQGVRAQGGFGKGSDFTQGGPGSAYDFVLGDEPTFCEKLTLHVGRTDAVDRPFRLQVANPNQVREDISGVDWRWRVEAGEQFVDLSFAEVRAQTLRLTITDFLNPAIQIFDAQGTMAARQLYFQWPDLAKTPLPLKLYFGNPEAISPNYDLEKRLPKTFDPAAAKVEVGPRETKPSYDPPEPYFSERHPSAIYVELAYACLVLAGLLVPLAKQALANAVGQRPVPDQAASPAKSSD